MKTPSRAPIVIVLGITTGCALPDASLGDPLEETDSGSDGMASNTEGDGDGDDAGDGDGDGDDAGDGDGDGDQPPEDFQLTLSQVKQFDFAWPPVVGAEYYQLLESADMGEPYIQVGQDIIGLSTSLTVPLHFRVNASYKLRACDGNGCTDSEPIDVTGTLVEAIGYFKASNTNSEDFGLSVALSGDGNTLAVNAPFEDSNATGIDGNQADTSAPDAGAVYVFVRDGGGWSQQAYVKASNTDAGDRFGSVALSGDGDTLAVGTGLEDSNATGIDGNQVDNSANTAGAVYVFVRNGVDWSQQAYVKASNTEAVDAFGSVALSGDGDTMAVGAPGEDSNAIGINGNQADNSAPDAGAVYVFVRNGVDWSQQAYIKASNSGSDDIFGATVALSGDGDTLAVGADREASSATGIDGNQADNSVTYAGAVYVFVRNGGAWSQQAYVKASNTDGPDHFGANVALSENGDTLAVGAFDEASSATGINGNQADNSKPGAGAAYVFVRDGGLWSQDAYVKASNTGKDFFGWSVSLSGDGNILAVGAFDESSDATGINGNQDVNSTWNSGAAYVFVRDGVGWSQKAYVKASNTGLGDFFGANVELSADGHTLAVSAEEEDSDAHGVGGNQDNNAAPHAGAVYLY
jgi:hypothetical protein